MNLKEFFRPNVYKFIILIILILFCFLISFSLIYLLAGAFVYLYSGQEMSLLLKVIAYPILILFWVIIAPTVAIFWPIERTFGGSIAFMTAAIFSCIYFYIISCVVFYIAKLIKSKFFKK
jgi:hypothetical protein